MSAEERLQELGLTLPEVPEPVASYVPGVRVDDVIFTAGQIPVRDGDLQWQGKVGNDLTVAEGYQAARLCGLNALAVVRSMAGSLDRVSRIVKMTGFVNSASGFHEQSSVVNGASELMGDVFGERGRHARSAVACNELPLDSAVEVELVAQVT